MERLKLSAIRKSIQFLLVSRVTGEGLGECQAGRRTTGTGWTSTISPTVLRPPLYPRGTKTLRSASAVGNCNYTDSFPNTPHSRVQKLELNCNGFKIKYELLVFFISVNRNIELFRKRL